MKTRTVNIDTKAWGDEVHIANFKDKKYCGKLLGLKENVIVGRLVPAGTGSIKNNWNQKALEEDEKFLSEQEKIETSETQVNQ